MIRPGKHNLITDVAGLKVGQAQDARVRTGVTVLIGDAPMPAAVDMRGGAPGTHETDALDPSGLAGMADAIVLSGGSVHGLDAAGAVTAWLAARGRGFKMTREAPPAPIVPAAILFDLANGGDKNWGEAPYRALALAAAESAGETFALGNAGAGFGAAAGIYKGGTGSASAVSEDGFTVGALAAVNSVGSPLIAGTDVFWAFAFEQNGEFGGKRLDKSFSNVALDLPPDMKTGARPRQNTLIAIVATDADLARTELKRIAVMAHDGMARAIRPAHTQFDGDTVFAVSTAKRALEGERERLVLLLGSLAADCLARAIARAVYEAQTLGSVRAYRDLFPPKARARK
jgi:L-aminopeptidase/D-esterase-like protein